MTSHSQPNGLFSSAVRVRSTGIDRAMRKLLASGSSATWLSRARARAWAEAGLELLEEVCKVSQSPSFCYTHTHPLMHHNSSPTANCCAPLNKRHKHPLLPLPHPIGTLLLGGGGQFMSGDSTAAPAGAVTIVPVLPPQALPFPGAAGSCFPRTVLVARTRNSNAKPTYRQMKSRCLKPAGSARLGACDSSFRGRPLLQRGVGWGWRARQLPLEACQPNPPTLSMSGLLFMWKMKSSSRSKCMFLPWVS